MNQCTENIIFITANYSLKSQFPSKVSGKIVSCIHADQPWTEKSELATRKTWYQVTFSKLENVKIRLSEASLPPCILQIFEMLIILICLIVAPCLMIIVADASDWRQLGLPAQQACRHQLANTAASKYTLSSWWWCTAVRNSWLLQRCMQGSADYMPG